MFRDACRQARGYTIPVVIARRAVNGDCSAALGAAVIINSDGWVITPAHIAEMLSRLSDQGNNVRQHPEKEAQIRADRSLNRKQKQKQLRAIGKPKPTDAQNFAVLWGGTGSTMNEMKCVTHVDIALGRLKNFDPSHVSGYPRFRGAKVDVEPGVSVCRVGYPFHKISTEWDDATNKFTFPNGVFPVPMFANEGIVTRLAYIEVQDETSPPEFKRVLIETSSPGLKGQSGGPIFDSDGRIWGIQSDTVSYRLGFAPKVNGRQEHQFLNVGRGVDAETVCGFLDQEGVSYQS